MVKNLFNVVMVLASINLFASNGLVEMNSNSELEKELANFPKAKKGFDRLVIFLEEKNIDEETLKIELIVGKTMMVDCNQHFMLGQIKEMDLKGWGYTYYEIVSKGAVGATKMACLEDKKTEAFVSMPSVLVRYNSRLPIVVYVPKGLEVKYKIWEAGKELKTALLK